MDLSEMSGLLTDSGYYRWTCSALVWVVCPCPRLAVPLSYGIGMEEGPAAVGPQQRMVAFSSQLLSISCLFGLVHLM